MSSVTSVSGLTDCIFKPAYLLIAFQQHVTDIIIHMHKNDGLENYLFFFFFTSGRFCLTHGSAEVRLHFRAAPRWSGRVHMYVILTAKTVWMPRLSWVFAGCTGHFVGFIMLWIMWYAISSVSRWAPIRVYTVFHSVSICWMHYSKKTPYCSNFKTVTANFSGVQIFQIFAVPVRMWENKKFPSNNCSTLKGK